jgi:hypothetical protein
MAPEGVLFQAVFGNIVDSAACFGAEMRPQGLKPRMLVEGTLC